MPRKTNDQIERRSLTIGELRVSEGGEDGPPQITGYAAIFDAQSEDLGGFREVIRRGAFAKTIQEADIRALWNHAPEYPLGRNRAGTLDLEEDDRGLAFTLIPPDTQYARDLLVSMRRGDVNQMSFGFEAIQDEWTEPPAGGGLPIRTLVEVRLYDVSPVTFPAYPQTSAEVRARAAQYQDPAPGQGAHDGGDLDDKARARLDLMARRLELADRE